MNSARQASGGITHVDGIVCSFGLLWNLEWFVIFFWGGGVEGSSCCAGNGSQFWNSDVMWKNVFYPDKVLAW